MTIFLIQLKKISCEADLHAVSVAVSGQSSADRQEVKKKK